MSDTQSVADKFSEILALFQDMSAFYLESAAVMYSKPVPGTTQCLDQWLEFNIGLGIIIFTSRYVETDETKPDYPSIAEFRVQVMPAAAEALAIAWIAEASLAHNLADARRTITGLQLQQ